MLRRCFSTSTKAFELITLEKRAAERTALIRLNRPKQLNALCDALVDELNRATAQLDNDPEVGCIGLWLAHTRTLVDGRN